MQASDLVVQAVDLLNNDKSLTAADKDAVHALINTCEDDALRDTKAALVALQSIRDNYSDGLQKSLNNLHAEGYDGAPLHDVDSDGVSAAQQTALADIRQVTNQAVVDQMAKVRAAQEALSKAAADLYARTALARPKARPPVPDCPSSGTISRAPSTTSDKFPTTTTSTPGR
jgi:hypothetical protein